MPRQLSDAGDDVEVTVCRESRPLCYRVLGRALSHRWEDWGFRAVRP